MSRFCRWAQMLSLVSLLGVVRPSTVSSQAPLTTWRVTEVWRRDGTESGDPLADPRDLLAMTDGTLWMLDFKDQRIRRFDAAGKELSSVGRVGAGPGEFRNANGMLLRPDATVWVNDPMNARIAVFAKTGKYLRQHRVGTWGWSMRWDAWTEIATGRVADPVPRTSGMGATGKAWRMLTATGVVHDSLAQPKCPSGAAPPFAIYTAATKGKNGGALQGLYPFLGGGGSAADGRGGFWCADAGSTRVALLRIPGGDTIAVTNVSLPPIAVARAERDSVFRAVRAKTGAYATSDFDGSRLRDTKPGIALVFVDYDGRLWVQHSRRFGTVESVFDVHDARGRHLGRVTLPRTMLHDGYLPLIARGDDVWAAVVDDDGVPSLARYRLSRAK